MALDTSNAALEEAHQALVETTATRELSIAQGIPAEIVTLIFWMVEPRRWCIDWRIGLIGRNTLWAGALVCAGWRAALLGDRQLWRRSSIDLHMMATCSLPGVLCGPLVAQTLFTRTVDLPIDVQFDSSGADQEEALDIITKDVAERCSSLTLRVPLSLYAYFVEKSIMYPVLRRLSISTDANWGDMSYCDGPRIGWEQFPSLTELSLSWQKLDVGPLPSVHQLTKLDISIGRFASIDLANFNQLLHGSTTLHDVHISIKGSFSRWADASIALAPMVERLKLGSKGTYILPRMTLPAVRSLSMELPRWDSWYVMVPEDILDHLVDFISRSGCVLEKFYLSSILVLPSELPRVLQAMPHLKSLELAVCHRSHRVGYVADFFNALCETTAGGNMRIVPFLERLSICVDAEGDVDVDILLGGHFVEAVLKRTEAVDSALRYVELAVDGPGTWDLQESDIRILKEREGQVDGLKIVVVDKARPLVLEYDGDN